jgi:uncharacterized membrane protein HdeD (DUF308 family)
MVTHSVLEPPANTLHHERVHLRRVWWLFFIMGLVSIVVGFLAISSRYIALTTWATVVFFGVLLLIAGITEVVQAVMVRNWRGFALHLLTAALYLIVGLFMLEEPDQGAKVLTLLIGAAFLVGGVLRIVFALVQRFHSWPWVVLHGVVDLFLGGIILSGWPESSLWVIGLLLGIDLIFHGWAWVILALTVRRYSAALAESPAP